MIIKSLCLGALQTNCYIVADETTKKAVVIDPADSVYIILSALEQLGAELQYIILTHGHFDHMGAAETLRAETGAEIICHEKEAAVISDPDTNLSMPFSGKAMCVSCDKTVTEEDLITFGESSLKVIHTPGHTVGGISLLGDGVVFSGDTLFYRSIGRTDFPGGNYGVLEKSIKEKLYTLPGNTVVYSGHGIDTTIGEEKNGNYYIR